MSLQASSLFTAVQALTTKFGVILDANDYDAILVKQLAATNTISDKGDSNQYHIALTGKSIGFFPLLYNNLYYKSRYSSAKRMFLSKIPVVLHQNNLDYLQSKTININNKDNVIKTMTTSVLSVRDTGSEQVELGDKSQDDPQWYNFRKLFITEDFLVFIRKKGKLEYDAFGFKGNTNLQQGVEIIDFGVRSNQNARVTVDIEQIFIPVKLAPPRQRILYGCPGTGKSTQVKNETAGMQTFRTTFHPEQDYYSFVGGFRPTMEGEGEGRKIAYSFVPQVFMEAYISAWRNLDVAHCLIIEEINRGNCAAIFGDLFQLLDRADDGFSEYVVQAEAEQRKYLAQALADSDYATNMGAVLAHRNDDRDPFSVLMLPSNLSILATMNTSDQSLYPMDSAFKRRWDWECCPIDYEKAAAFSVAIGENTYNWRSFLQAVNQKVYALTQSEDKQVGTFFVKPKNNLISTTDFVNKVLFYLWTDVLKDENPNGEHFFFKQGNQPFTFNDLFDKTQKVERLTAIFANLGVQVADVD